MNAFHKPATRIRALFPLAVLLVFAESAPAGAARPTPVFTVNAADDGLGDGCDARHCNLREAIDAADAERRAVIRFALPAATVIRPLSALPPLTGDVEIDGSSPGGTACPAPGVRLDGGLLPRPTPQAPLPEVGGDGLVLLGDRNAVSGLAITRFPRHGVVVRGDDNTLRCLSVGVDETGAAAGNGGDGIVVAEGRGNRIGGPDPAHGNLLSGNGGIGLRLRDALATRERFNAIGVDRVGRPTLPNGNADPEAELPPPPREPLPPAAAARLAARIEKKLERLERRWDKAVARSGILGRYAALLGPNLPVQPTSLLELSRLLAPRPDLYGPFTAEIAALNERERERAALQLARARNGFRRSPSFLREVRAYGAPDPLADQISGADPNDIALSGPPTAQLALQTDPPILPLSPFLFSHLGTYGPTSFSSDVLNQVDLACPGPGPCDWPIVYDLLPRTIDLLWETDDFTAQEVTDMVEEDDHFFAVYLNGNLLLKGPPFGSPGDTGAHHYWAARLPSADCPNANRCVAVQVRVRDKLHGVALPWTFELRISRLDDLEVPVIGGIDEFGNPILLTKEAVVINRSFKTFEPNPTNDESWFVAAMEETFRSDRCVQCHGLDTIEELAAQHAAVGLPSDVALAPSLFVPGGHVITCSNCHSMPLTDDLGTPFHEIEWRTPYFDLDTDWSTKTAAQICATVKSHLPTNSLRHLHFHGDARLFWAIEDTFRQGITLLPKAEPKNYQEFLRRFDLWNLGGAPCP